MTNNKAIIDSKGNFNMVEVAKLFAGTIVFSATITLVGSALLRGIARAVAPWLF